MNSVHNMPDMYQRLTLKLAQWPEPLVRVEHGLHNLSVLGLAIDICY